MGPVDRVGGRGQQILQLAQERVERRAPARLVLGDERLGIGESECRGGPQEPKR